MAAPVLQSLVPADASTGISVQQTMIAKFNVAIKRTSVNAATFLLYRNDDEDNPLDGAFSFSNSDKTVTFVPEHVLDEDTLYKVRVVGSDLATGSALRSTGGEFLAATTTYLFRTGEERFVRLEEVTTRDDLERVGPIRETDPLAIQPSGGVLEIEKRTPAIYTNALVTTTGLSVDFDQLLKTSTVTVSTVVVEQHPVLGIDQYYASIPTGKTTPQLATQQSVTLTPPGGTLDASSDLVYWTLNPTDDFLYNTEVIVKVTTEVESESGATLLAETEYFFTTQYYPLFFNARMLRTELGPAVSSLYDDTLRRIIHKNSIEAWELSGRTISLDTPPYVAIKWVKCQSIVDVIDVLMLSRDMRAGQSKTLGDFTVSNRPADPELGAKYKSAKDCLDEITLADPSKAIALAAVKGSQAFGERADFKMRTWDHLLLQGAPMANSGAERYEKTRLSIDYAFDGKDILFNQAFLLRALP